MAQTKKLSKSKTAKPGKPAFAREKLASEKRILSPESQRSANLNLISAVRDNDLREIKTLIEVGANIETTDKNGWTPLSIAAWNGQNKICEFLLERGANINARNADKENNTFYGHNALMRAIRSGKLETCKLLIEKGADLDARDGKDQTVLMMAVGHPEICAYLIDAFEKKGGNARKFIEAKDDQDQTALIHNSFGGSARTCGILIEKLAEAGGDIGAYIEMPGKDCLAAVDHAINCGHIDTKDYLNSIRGICKIFDKKDAAKFVLKLRDCLKH